MIPFHFIHIPKTGGASICKAFDLALGSMHIKASTATHHFKFAFVRDPYTRVQSAFHFLRDVQRSTALAHMTFRDWVLNNDGWLSEFTVPMTLQLDAPVQFIGRYERLHADFARVCAIIDRQVTLPHEHKCAVAKEPYDAETRAKVREIYAADFTRFGYGP